MIGNLLSPYTRLLSIGFEVCIVVYSRHELYWPHILPNKAIDLFRIRLSHLNTFLFAIGLFLILCNLWFSPLAFSVASILRNKIGAEITKRSRNITACLACITCANPEPFEITIEVYSAEEVV
jgi:hypothetical protein